MKNNFKKLSRGAIGFINGLWLLPQLIILCSLFIATIPFYLFREWYDNRLSWTWHVGGLGQNIR